MLIIIMQLIIGLHVLADLRHHEGHGPHPRLPGIIDIIVFKFVTNVNQYIGIIEPIQVLYS